MRRGVHSLLNNPPQLVEMVFWPTFEIVVWGFVSLFLRANGVHTAVAALLGAVLLWQLLARSQGELSVSLPRRRVEPQPAQRVRDTAVDR